MKRPYLSLEQRNDIKHDTYYGAKLRLHLALKLLEKSLIKGYGCLIGKFIYYKIMKTKINLNRQRP